MVSDPQHHQAKGGGEPLPSASSSCCVEASCPCYARGHPPTASTAAPSILECSPQHCGCPPQHCGLRTTQSAQAPPLELRRTGGKGWGVFYAPSPPSSSSSLPAGAYVTEYVGELLSTEEARRRLVQYDKEGLNYLLVVREEATEVVLRISVDATHKGNVARFLNHSCAPNLELVLVRAGMLLPRLAFFTSRDVRPGEELTFSYGDEKEEAEEARPPPTQPKEKGQPPRRPCRCGSTACRGVLPFYPGL